MQHDPILQGAPIFAGLMFIFMMVLVLFLNILWVLVFCKICAKAGYSWALGLLILVPIANFVLPIYLGFADWPVRKELRELNQRLGQAPT